MPKGDGSRKLSEQQCTEIIERYITPLPDGTWLGTLLLSREYGVTDTAIQAMLKRRGIARRTMKEAHTNGKRCKPIINIPKGDAPLCACNCGSLTVWNRAKNRWNRFAKGHQYLLRRLQGPSLQHSYGDREWLYEQYVIRRRSVIDIGRDFGVTSTPIVRHLDMFGITRRGNRAAQMGIQAGENNPAWKGGVTPERQRQYKQQEGKEFLKAIYARDNYTCQRCGGPKPGPKGLHAHHIRPWANAPELRFDPANVITLCRTCHSWVHSKANAQREYLA